MWFTSRFCHWIGIIYLCHEQGNRRCQHSLQYFTLEDLHFARRFKMKLQSQLNVSLYPRTNMHGGYVYVCSVMSSYCPDIFLYLGLNLRNSYEIASLFDMYIYMGERIAGKQDRPNYINEDPRPGPQITKHIFKKNTFWPLCERLVFTLFPLVVHMSQLWWDLHLLIFRCPWYPWTLYNMTPE